MVFNCLRTDIQRIINDDFFLIDKRAIKRNNRLFNVRQQLFNDFSQYFRKQHHQVSCKHNKKVDFLIKIWFKRNK